MSTMDLKRTNSNQADRARQGIAVFSRLGERDLFAADTIEARSGGWRVILRNPWYTGTYLSTLSRLRLTVNGHVVPEADTLFTLRGQTVPVAYLRTLHELWWGMGETAEVLLTDPALAEAIRPVNDVGVEIDMRTTFSYGFPDDTLPYRLSGELEAR